MAGRIIAGKSYDIRPAEILNEVGWQPLDERRKYNKAMFIHKIRRNELPDSTIIMFNAVNHSNYSLCSNNLNYTLLKPNTKFIKKGISYSAARPWNDLPNSIKEKEVF